jgi:hypothetical protein
MTLSSVFLILAVLFSLFAYVAYFRDIKNDLISPNRWSWLIWSFAVAVEAFTYEALNQDLMKSLVFFIASAACIIITLLIWKKARWERPDWTELFTVAASIAALVLWLNFNSALWAHWLMVLAVPIAFVPTWRNSVRKREQEDSIAWGLWTLGDLFTLFVIMSRYTGVQELPFIIVELVCHFVVWVLIRRNVWLPQATRSDVVIRNNHLGRAVFAGRAFKQGEIIMPVTGPRMRFIDVPPVPEHYMQVGIDEVLGPSGAADDLVNHSCDPNAGTVFSNSGIHFVAIRDIAPGEEITWDYSTTSLGETGWSMKCECRTAHCRGVIGDFTTLDLPTQKRYRSLGIIPDYITSYMDTHAPTVY